MTPGKPILAPNRGFIHLAHMTKSGLQLSIENWSSLADARRAFPAAAVETAAGPLKAAEVELLICIADGIKPQNWRGMKALHARGLVTAPKVSRKQPAALTPAGEAIAEVMP